MYEVVSRSNFDGGILTSDRKTETGVTCVRITGVTVKTLQEMPSQSNTAPLPSCARGLGLTAGKRSAAHRRARHASRRHHHRRPRR